MLHVTSSMEPCSGEHSFGNSQWELNLENMVDVQVIRSANRVCCCGPLINLCIVLVKEHFFFFIWGGFLQFCHSNWPIILCNSLLIPNTDAITEQKGKLVNILPFDIIKMLFCSLLMFSETTAALAASTAFSIFGVCTAAFEINKPPFYHLSRRSRVPIAIESNAPLTQILSLL